MAYEDSQKNRFTNRDAMKSSEAKLKAKGPSAAPPQADGYSDEEQGPAPAQDGAALASQHGPAQEVHITHDHASGAHSVHVVHPDMHEHESQHGSAAEAHKFAGDCAGGGM
jgi:hypothetical protein